MVIYIIIILQKTTFSCDKSPNHDSFVDKNKKKKNKKIAKILNGRLFVEKHIIYIIPQKYFNPLILYYSLVASI